MWRRVGGSGTAVDAARSRRRGSSVLSTAGRVIVEVLYFDGCPGHEVLLPRLRELVRRAGVSAEIELRAIEDDETAQRERFLGSPTVRIDGRDVERAAESRADFGMKCRLYRSEEGVSGQPSEESILAALRAGEPCSSDPPAG
jgi:hypothetical protein